MGKIREKKVTFHKSALKSIKCKKTDSEKFKKPSVKVKLIKDKVVKKNLKKGRMHMRRDSLKTKLENLKKNELDKVAQIKRSKTVIVGDMQPMLSALMENLDQTSKFTKLSRDKIVLPKKKFTVKKRMKDIADGLEYFRNGLNSAS